MSIRSRLAAALAALAGFALAGPAVAGASGVATTCPGSTTAACPYSGVLAIGGVSAAELRTPSSLAVDGAGDVHVVDSSDDRVQLYDATGAFVRTIYSWDPLAPVNAAVPDDTTTIATDAAGDTYADSDGQIYEVSPTGSVVQTFTLPAPIVAPPPGTPDLPLGAMDVAVDQQTGDVYTIAFDRSLIVEFAPDGTFLTDWAFTPRSAAIDDQLAAGGGSVYLLEDGEVTRFDAGGGVQASWQVPPADAIAADSAGDAYVSEWDAGVVEEFDPTGRALAQFGLGNPQDAESGSDAGAVLSAADGVAVSSAGVFVSDSNTDQVLQFAADGSLERSFGGHPTGEFSHALGVVSSPDGKSVYVADWNSNDILEFDAAGSFEGVFAALPTEYAASGAVVPFHPFALGRSADGGIYVLGEQGLARFTAAGALASAWLPAGAYPDFEPLYDSLAVSPAGDVYLILAGSPAVTEYSPDGELLGVIGGGGPGALSDPVALAVDPAGNLWVDDAGDREIDEYGTAGAYETQIPARGTECSSMAIDPAGDLVLGCEGSVTAIEPNGLRGVSWYVPGGGLGDVSFPNVSQVAVDAGGDVYVADPTSDAIDVYTLRGPLAAIDGPAAAIYTPSPAPLVTPTGIPGSPSQLTPLAFTGRSSTPKLVSPLDALPTRATISGGAIKVTLRCGAGVPCRGTLTLERTIAAAVAPRAAASQTVGRAHFSIAAGHARTIRVAVSRAVRASLAGRRNSRLLARAVVGRFASSRWLAVR